MSLVERVAVLVAIILGLALAELGTSFHRLMRATGALVIRNIRIQQAAVLFLVEVTTWVYVVSARAFH
jgi:hypothetical protein